jgi:hypothetical protein
MVFAPIYLDVIRQCADAFPRFYRPNRELLVSRETEKGLVG